MITPRMRRGRLAEDAAMTYLQAHGLRLVSRNFRCRTGEIDLVMTTHDTLVFVEVRYRKNTGRATGAETVTTGKMRKLISAARHYLAQHRISPTLDCRFDVISIGTTIDWIQNAFTLDN